MSHLSSIDPRRGASRAPGAALLLAGALATAACGGDSRAEARSVDTAVTVGAENVTVVTTEQIETGPVVSGSIRPVREAAVRAEIGGSVLQTFAEKGQAVGRGAPLARIDDAAIRDAHLSAQSGVRSAQNALEVARREAERAGALVQAGAVAERDLELARRNLTAAQAQLADARARLAQAEKQLGSTTVRSPIAGVVTDRPVNAGDVVAPGAPLFTVIDPGQMRLEASVPTTELGALRVGAPVRFTVNGYPGQTFEGRVERISPAADPATRQVPIYVTIPNTQGTLVAGLFAEGRVASQSRTALVVPAVALDESGATPAVARIRAGKVERVPVQTGLRDEQTERVEITAGVAAGDTLLVGAARGITPGTPVRVQGAAGAARN
ncbi:MAG TPA: efflux RND transporter periplasmic adaptor subunit [Longimicrobiaceae bacterium]|nr:efflux RND transporter periplasmic adaptor subunit [Longimicrobiaceae bacterium]